MALIKCPECGNDISDKAKMCPKCGYQMQGNNNVMKIVGVILLIIFIVASVIVGSIYPLIIGALLIGAISTFIKK